MIIGRRFRDLATALKRAIAFERTSQIGDVLNAESWRIGESLRVALMASRKCPSFLVVLHVGAVSGIVNASRVLSFGFVVAPAQALPSLRKKEREVIFVL